MDMVSTAAQPSPTAPNVIIIVIDDRRFADFGCYGSEVSTPVFDGLARRGLRYNNFHVTAICEQTRACLLTGRNHHRGGMEFFPDVPAGLPGYSGRIPRSAATLARLLKDTGYNTFALGKWHLTPRSDRTSAASCTLWPLGMGFEQYYGSIGGVTNQWSPDLVHGNEFIEPPATPGDGYRLTEDLVSRAIRMIQHQQQAASGKPFFAYFSTGAMHSPHQVPREQVERYRHRFDEGWEAVRRQTFARQREMGLIPPEATLVERPDWVPAWDELSAEARRVLARQMEVYAGFLSHTDAQVGRLLDFLRRIEALDNTLIMVLSDSGAAASGGPMGVVDTGEVGAVLGAHDVASMAAQLDDLDGPQLFNHYAWGWAWAGNTPFKLWKRYSWLGGVRVPLIVHWPDRITGTDQVRTQFGHAIDVMPTILDAASVEFPETVDGVSQLPLDGASLLATFGEVDAPSPRSVQYFETVGSRAIYLDGWKATTDRIDGTLPYERDLIPGSRDFDTDGWSLYNLELDFAETRDLADENPERLRRLVEMWWHEAGRNQVRPLVDGFGSQEWKALLAPPPHPERHEGTYWPDAGAVKYRSFVNGFQLRADIEIGDDHHASGVIFAHHHDSFGGTVSGGWGCYVHGNRLAVISTPGWTPAQTIIADTTLSGRHEIEITYIPRPEEEPAIRIALDGREVAHRLVPATSGKGNFFESKLVIGRGIDGFRLCDDYEPPFPFTGHIHRITYVIHPQAERDLPQEIAAAQHYD